MLSTQERCSIGMEGWMPEKDLNYEYTMRCQCGKEILYNSAQP
jgi:hypothetical protein